MRRVSIKASEYRGKQGFTVTISNGSGHFPSHVFCQTREGAEAIKAVHKRTDDRTKIETVIDAILTGGL